MEFYTIHSLQPLLNLYYAYVLSVVSSHKTQKKTILTNGFYCVGPFFTIFSQKLGKIIYENRLKNRLGSCSVGGTLILAEETRCHH